MRKIGLIVLFSTLLLTSCNNSLKRALTDLQNMPPPDYSYIVQPEYNSDKESIEFKLKELYSAEEVKIGAVGTHGYDNETKAQNDEIFWFKVILLNSKAIEDFKDEQKMNELGREVAKSTISSIKNVDKYEKTQITFVEQWNDGIQKQMKQNIFYSLPDLKITQLFNE